MPLFLPLPSPLIIADESMSVSGSSQTLVINNIYLYAFELFAVTTFTGAKWRIAATATGGTDIGIYSFAGTLLANIGGTNNTANTSMSANFTSNLTIGPGQYFAALSPSNSTDTYFAIASFTNVAVLSRCRLATNNSTGTSPAVVLPSSTGGYSDAPAKFPAFALTISGGLT